MVFVMDKAVIVMIVMYAMSFSLFGGQYIFADMFGVTLTNFQGQPVKSNLLAVVQINTFNAITQNSTTTTKAAVQSNPLVTAALAGFELFQLATGTYIFNVMYFFAIPLPFVAAFTGTYVILLARFLIGIIKEFI